MSNLDIVLQARERTRLEIREQTQAAAQRVLALLPAKMAKHREAIVEILVQEFSQTGINKQEVR